jgi:hypothetical protein
LAFVGDERPFCKGAAGIAARCYCRTCRLGRNHNCNVDTFVLDVLLSWSREAWRGEAHVLILAKPLVDPFEREPEAETAMGRGRLVGFDGR